MFGLDLLLVRRSGEVLRLGPKGRAGLIGLPAIAEMLYRTARVLRCFTWPERRELPPERLAALASLPQEMVAKKLEQEERLL